MCSPATTRVRARSIRALAAIVAVTLGVGAVGGIAPAGAAEGPAPASGTRTVIADVHTDAIATFWDDGQLVLASMADTPELGTVYEADDVWFHVDDDSQVTWPANGPSFVASPGATVWLAPQAQQAGQIWPGFSTESVPAGTLDGDDTTLTLESVDGPGAVEVWQTEAGGSPTRLWSSDESIEAFTIDPVHMHANWAFTQPGVYDLTVRADATVGGASVGDTAVYTFIVGELPETVLTTTTLEASDTEVTVGDPVTLTATVSPAAIEDITGAVEFRDGSTVLGHDPIDDTGIAELAVPGLSLGSHSITAHFVPETTNLAAGSTSQPVVVTVADDSGVPFGITGLEDQYEVGDVLDVRTVGYPLAEGETFVFQIRPIGSTASPDAWISTSFSGVSEEEIAAGHLTAAVDLGWDGYELRAGVSDAPWELTGTYTPWLPISVAQPDGVDPISTELPAAAYEGNDIVFPLSRPLAEGESVRVAYRQTVNDYQWPGLWSPFPGGSTVVDDTVVVGVPWGQFDNPSYPGKHTFAVQVVRDGLVVAQSEPGDVPVNELEILLEGLRPVYRVGQTLSVTANVYPPSDDFFYRWSTVDEDWNPVVLSEGTDADARSFETPVDLSWNGRFVALQVYVGYGTDEQRLVKATFPTIVVSDADPDEQLFFLENLAGHYHQGDPISLGAVADPALAEGDTIVWEWRWPSAEWAPLPGASGPSHQLTAEQALDGVQVRATLDYGDSEEVVVADAVTIHHDDHGAAARQKPTVGGPTSFIEGDSLALVRELPANGPTVLSDHRWERKAAGSDEWTVVEGQTGAELTVSATLDDDGAAYRVSILKPTGDLAYGPSPAVTLEVVEAPTTPTIVGVEGSYEVGDVLTARALGHQLAANQTWRWFIRPIGSTTSGSVFSGDGPGAEVPQGRLRQLLDASRDGFEIRARVRIGTSGSSYLAGGDTPWVGIDVEHAVEAVAASWPDGEHYAGELVELPLSRPLAAGESVRLMERCCGGYYPVEGATVAGDVLRWWTDFAFDEDAEWVLQTVRDGVVVAVSDVFHGTVREREVLIEGLRPVYRVGQTMSLTAEVHPTKPGLLYRWFTFELDPDTFEFSFPVIEEGTGPDALTVDVPMTMEWHDQPIYFAAIDSSSGEEVWSGQWSDTVTVSDAPADQQLLFFGGLSGHYHQGNTINLELVADPELADGDTVTWEWLWPGTEEWVPFPGASGLAHDLTAEQGLDGVQVRATVDFAADGVESMTTELVTIHVDDHGAAARQVPTVGGPTEYLEGEGLALTRELPENGPTVLTEHRWERRAAGSEEWSVIEGQTGVELSLPATLADDGASYRVSIVVPNGEVAYGPSAPVTITVAEETATELAIAGVEGAYELGDVLRARVVGRDLEENQTWRWIIRPVGSDSSGYVFSGDGDQGEVAQGRLRQLLDVGHDGYEIRARLRQGSQYVAGVDTPWVPISVAAAAGVEPIDGTFPAGPHHIGDDISFPASRPAADGETVRLVYRNGSPWIDYGGPTLEGDTFSWRVSFGSFEGEEYAWQTIRAGAVVAMSEPFTLDLRYREVLVQGVKSIYRVGETLQATAEVFPPKEGLTYRWLTYDSTGEVVLEEGTDAAALTLELPIDSLDWDGEYLYLAAIMDAGTDQETWAGYWEKILTVSDAPPGEQLVFLSDLAGHYHQGNTIDLELAADPALASGDTVSWEWSWPGKEEWVPLPGASGTSHELTAEQALDGVQVRATVDFAAAGVASMTTEPVTIHHDDHGSPARQQPTIGGTTAVTERDMVTLSRQLPENGPTVLTEHRWERRSVGSDDWTVVDGETGAGLSFRATLGHDGAQYRVALVRPNGDVAYGPSPAVTVAVADAPALSAHGSWVWAAYADFLGRGPTPEEVSAMVARLDGGTSRATIARELAMSDEWLTTIVTRIYIDTLGREPDAEGLAYWTGKLRSGDTTVAKVAASFYGSGEYFAGIGGGTDESWVTDLYATLLEREPEGDGLAYWTGQIGLRGRGWVALQMFQSLESRRARVAGLYQDLLGRAPEDAGRDYWAGRLTAEGDIALARHLAASGEYLARAQTRYP